MRFVALVVAVLVPLAASATTTVSSGPERVSLVELYTSEGCSSCPPADESLSQLTKAKGLWRAFVPVAFHVTYWDRLGWEDRFADARFDRRQKAYAHHWGHGVVYTPGFVIDGREWRASDARRGLAEKALSETDQGRLRARIADGTASVAYRGGSQRALTVHTAILGFGLTTSVKAGENTGRTLHHDFVVLDYARAALAAGEEGREAELAVSLDHDAPDRLAIAVWVARRGEPAPIQAAGGWLDD